MNRILVTALVLSLAGCATEVTLSGVRNAPEASFTTPAADS